MNKVNQPHSRMSTSIDFRCIGLHSKVIHFLQFCCVMLDFEWTVKSDFPQWLLPNQLAIILVFAIGTSESVGLSDFNGSFWNYLWTWSWWVVDNYLHIMENVSVTTETPTPNVCWQIISTSVRITSVILGENWTNCDSTYAIEPHKKLSERESENDWRRNTKTSAIQKLDCCWV